MTAVQQVTVVNRTAVANDTGLGKLALFNSDGTPFAASTFKQVAARSDAAAATSTAAAGANPTKAEFDALRNDYLALRTVVNDLLAKMRTAEVLDT